MIMIAELVKEFRDKEPIQVVVEKMYTQTELFNTQLATKSSAQKVTTKNKRGRPVKKFKNDLIDLLNGIPEGSCTSQADLARKLNYKASTFTDHIKKYQIDISKYLKKHE